MSNNLSAPNVLSVAIWRLNPTRPRTTENGNLINTYKSED